MKKISDKLIKYIFTVILLLQLILKNYGIRGIGGTFADYSLVIVSVYIIFKQKRMVTGKSTVMSFLPFFVYVFVNFFLTFHRELPFSDQFIDWFRSLLYYFVLIFGTKKYFDYLFGYKIYTYLAIVATSFLIIQYVSAIFWGRYISGFWAPLTTVDLKEMYSKFTFYAITTYRPNSFFAEPAHYATFIIPLLSIMCFEEIKPKSIYLILFLSSGILISGSTTGLILCVFCIMVWLFRFFRETRNFKYLIVTVVLAVIAFSFVSSMDSYKFMFFRTFESDNAINSRLKWLTQGTFPFNGVLDYLFGVGNCTLILQSRQGWLPGWALLFQNYGIIGFVIYVMCSLYFFWKGNSRSRFILCVFWILSIGAEVCVDQHLLYFLSFSVACSEWDKHKRSVIFEKEKVK